MQIYFVRHGETDWNAEGRMQGHSDTPLNAKGLVQAERIAARLSQEGGPFTTLYTSPLQRAYVTARTIGAALNLEPRPEPRLIEHGVGPLEGMTLDEIKVQHPEVYAAWTQGEARPRFPGEETRAEIRERLLSLLDDLKARHCDEKIIAVTHGGALNAYFALIAGIDPERRSPFWFENASLSVVDFGWPWVRLRLVNDTCHLRYAEAHPADAMTGYTRERAAEQAIKNPASSNGEHAAQEDSEGPA